MPRSALPLLVHVSPRARAVLLVALVIADERGETTRLGHYHAEAGVNREELRLALAELAEAGLVKVESDCGKRVVTLLEWTVPGARMVARATPPYASAGPALGAVSTAASRASYARGGR